MECSVSLGDSQHFIAAKEVRSDAFVGVHRPHLVPPRPQRSGCGLSFSFSVCECFRVFRSTT